MTEKSEKMKKKLCDTLGFIFLALGIIALPLCRGHFGLSDRVMTALVCGITVFLILLVKVIGWKTGYTPAERRDDRVNFWILLVFLVVLIVIGLIPA